MTEITRPELPTLGNDYHWQVTRTADLTTYVAGELHAVTSALTGIDAGQRIPLAPYVVQIVSSRGSMVALQPLRTLTPEEIRATADALLARMGREQALRDELDAMARHRNAREAALLGTY